MVWELEASSELGIGLRETPALESLDGVGCKCARLIEEVLRKAVVLKVLCARAAATGSSICHVIAISPSDNGCNL